MFINVAGLFDGIASVARAEGITGLYSGLGPTLLAIAPFMAVQQVSVTVHPLYLITMFDHYLQVTYDILKQKALDSKAFAPSATLFLVCGSAAGAVAQTVSGVLKCTAVVKVYIVKI